MNIVFFDGVCNLCNSSINLLIKIDNNEKLKYSSLQGKTAKKLISSDKLKHLNTIYYYKDGKLYEKSTAVAKILIDIGGFYKFVGSLLNIFPAAIFNIFYNFISKNRYKMFGINESCRRPTAQEKTFFLD